MGDLDSSTSTPKENGQLGYASASPWPPETENPHPSSIPNESWILAEETMMHMITKIQPTKQSEERRRNVIEYIQKIIKQKLGCEVFPYGSVPLKTYLPDGDIDLTAIDTAGHEDSLTRNLSSVLEAEECNNDSEFKLKDVQTIHAEVRLVKCLVQNIVVDISCDQIGGLSTLCFLNEVSEKIGKDNLFKRTIILIKAWCYYESRILGAHHSLISTYALETLVLYIFHLFHSSLDGPLAVLYRFLDYFSKFDWDNLCVSLHSPVVDVPETDRDLLLSSEFLSKCGEDYLVHPKASETNRLFVKKYLNIVDPLKENNNLGRSVSKGNLYRIRSAFAYGARKLGKILTSSRENMPNELRMFFKNTLERHGNGERPDMQNTFLDTLKVTDDNLAVSSLSSSNRSTTHGGTVDLSSTKTSSKEISKGLENRSASMLDLRTIKESNTSTSTGVSNPSSKAVYLPPHLIWSNVKKISKNDVNGNKLASLCSNSTDSSSNRAPDSSDCSFNREQEGNRDSAASQGKESNDKCETPSDYELADLSGESGDYQLHLNNMHYAQYVHFIRSVSSQNNVLPCPQYTPPTGQLYPSVNGYFSGPPPFHNYYNKYTMNPSYVPQHQFVIDETQKHRGTGTYIPTTHNQRTFRDKLPMAGRGRNQQFLPNMMPRPRNNSRPVTPLESNMIDTRGILNGRGQSGQFDFSQAPITPLPRGFPQVNDHIHSFDGHIHSLDSQLQFQTLDSPVICSPNQEYGGNPESKNPYTHHISATVVSSPMSQKPGMRSNMERLAQSYRLKDDDEFPPLSNRGSQNSFAPTNEQETCVKNYKKTVQ